jgi:hypothetical protein
MRRHLDFLDFGERVRGIEWRKCSIRESRTHCVLKFARKFFDEISPRACAKFFFKSSFAHRIDPSEVRVKGFERRDDLVVRRRLAGGGRLHAADQLVTAKMQSSRANDNCVKIFIYYGAYLAFSASKRRAALGRPIFARNRLALPSASHWVIRPDTFGPRVFCYLDMGPIGHWEYSRIEGIDRPETACRRL